MNRTRLTVHDTVARQTLRNQYGALPPRMRLVVFAVSTHGAFGAAAMRFLSDLSRRSGGGLPPVLLDCASWAVPRFAPFVRMAVCHAVRRGLAEAVLRHWRRVRDPSDLPSVLPPADPAPPPVPLPALPLPPGLPAPVALPGPGPDPLAAAVVVPPGGE